MSTRDKSGRIHRNSYELFDDADQPASKKWLPIAGAGVLVLCLGGAAWGLINAMSGTAAPSQSMVQQISIVQPPPPPPPPPRMEEPEPEVEEMELDEPEPEPMADDLADVDQSLDDALGLDADGVAGADGFGLQAKRGGRGLLGGDPNAWYAGILQRDLQMQLSQDDDVRGGTFSVIVNIWLTDDGVIESAELVSGTNNPELDSALRRAMEAGTKISRVPPPDLPQPVRLRISSRS